MQTEPLDEERPAEPEQPPTRTARMRARRAAAQARAQRIAERAQAERSRHGSLDAAFEIADRDAEVGGNIIAGALAYRFFIWLLPAALVFVAGLGIGAAAASESPKKAADSLGLAGLVSHSVASAAKSSNRWYALMIGIPLLLWATRSALRALVVAHRLVWTEVRGSVPKVKPRAVLRFLGLIIVLFAFTALASEIRSRTPGPGLLATLAVIVPYAVIWLAISLQLPHRGAKWTALIPGALVFAVGAQVLNLVTTYYLVPESEKKQGTYGVLGLSAALLLGLFLLSRIMVGSAVLNATLWERQSRSE
ncbi:MAG TPA: YhjD/YihY/BrkB family envelope integrity protein [Gaiellaceae bacterium]|nr:YhjD/YihY/BrkB family envelope integrity protein [Gaiellaceae bacterium]